MKILSFPVTWAMAILTALGIASVLVFAWGVVSLDLKQQARLKDDALLTSLAADVGGLTHELQKERGASAGFLASGGTAFVDALPAQRLNSDSAIARFQSSATSLKESVPLEPAFAALLEDVEGQIAALPELRSRVDSQSIERPAAVGQITRLNRSAIGLLPELGKKVTYSDAARAVQRHAVLMTAKDVMGLERAFGAAGYSQASNNNGDVPANLLARFDALVAEQETLLSVYSAIASPALLDGLEQLRSADATKGVVSMRETLLSGDPAARQSVAPEIWFQAITEKINLVKALEDAGSAEIQSAVGAALSRSRAELRSSISRLVLNAAVMIGLSAVLIYLTSKSLNTTANRVMALAEGDVDSPVVQAPQRDLAKITSALGKFQEAERQRRADAEKQIALEAASADGIKRISKSVSTGDFADRLRLRDLQGASLILGEGINEILSSAENFVVQRQKEDAALLAQKQAENEAQEQAIAELDAVVTSYSEGDFSKRMLTEGLDGVWQRVGQGINQIAGMTESALNEIRLIMTSVADGSLDRRMSAEHKGTFSEIASATNVSLGKLEDAFNRISDGVTRVGEAATELRQGSKDLNTRSDEQASTVSESTTATKELSTVVEGNSKNLGRCKDLMLSLKSKTAEGQSIAKDAVHSMSGIEQASNEMEKIVATIDEIAFQTNLLALNASVEAARAGDAGKGFAVVAAEVRGLANRCAEASRQIGDLIGDSVRGVTEGASHVRRTGEAISDVEETLVSVQSVIDDVLVAGQTQSDRVSLLTDAIMRLDKTATSNVELARDNMALTESLAEQENQLSKAVDRFLKHQPVKESRNNQTAA